MIELLVVVSIIAVLASIMLPTLGMVRSQARTMSCASNLRQIGMGITAYAADNRGLMPDIAIISTGHTTIRWAELITDYVQAERSGGSDGAGTGTVDLAQRSILTACPEWKAPQVWVLGYGMNMNPDKPARPNATHRWDYRAVNGNMVHFPLAHITDKASRLLITDTEDYHAMASIVSLNRHRGAFNVLFFDGRVQPLRGADQLNRVTEHPELGMP